MDLADARAAERRRIEFGKYLVYLFVRLVLDRSMDGLDRPGGDFVFELSQFSYPRIAEGIG